LDQKACYGAAKAVSPSVALRPKELARSTSRKLEWFVSGGRLVSSSVPGISE
jgi:hypothetical protein